LDVVVGIVDLMACFGSCRFDGMLWKLPTIDYFVNGGKHNTFIELDRDSSKLAEHFDKFELDGAAPGQKSNHAGKYYQYRDNYMILDLVLGKAQPTPIPEKHAKATLSKYYSFVAATNTLYLAGRVVKEKMVKRPGPAVPTGGPRSFESHVLLVGSIVPTFVALNPAFPNFRAGPAKSWAFVRTDIIVN
jgi:hypothetical protein